MAPIHFGSLVFVYQAIDVIGPFDLLNSSSKRLMTAMKLFRPVDKEALACAPEIVFHHIGETRDPVPLLTSALIVVPTATVNDCPELGCLSRWAQPGPFLSSAKVCQVHSGSCCCWETPFYHLH